MHNDFYISLLAESYGETIDLADNISLAAEHMVLIVTINSKFLFAGISLYTVPSVAFRILNVVTIVGFRQNLLYLTPKDCSLAILS